MGLDINYPFDRPREEILMDLIYQFNQYRTPLDRMKFGVPIPLDIYPDIKTDENTLLPVHVQELYDGRFDGRNGFLIRRIPLSELVEDESVNFDIDHFPFRMVDILPQLNRKFHVQLREDDILNTLVRSHHDFVLKANPYSTLWVDSTPFNPGGAIPEVSRLLEDDTPRAVENGGARLMEDASLIPTDSTAV